MVKVAKIAVWKVGAQYFESIEPATTAVRRAIIEELMLEDGEDGLIWDEVELNGCISDWVSTRWNEIERRVKEALAGT